MPKTGRKGEWAKDVSRGLVLMGDQVDRREKRWLRTTAKKKKGCGRSNFEAERDTLTAHNRARVDK